MQPEERDRAYLRDIAEAGRAALDLVQGVTREQFLTSKLERFATERQMTIVGEAARRVSETFKAAHPEVPWAGMIAFRNVLIHEYGTVRVDRVWHIVTTDVPPMLAAIEPLLPDRGEER